MASDSCDLVRRRWCCACGGRVVRHRNQKDSGANADAYSIAQTSAALGEETHSHAIAYCLAQTKESFTDSVANAHAEEQIEAKKGESNSNTGARRKSTRESIGNASTF